MKTVREAFLSGKKVLLRADLDVPLKDGRVRDDRRLKAAVETLDYLCNRGSDVLVVGHTGRPGGRVDPRFSLSPICKHFSSLSKKDISLANSFEELADFKGVWMLENLRFWPGEEGRGVAPSFYLSIF